MVNLSGAQILGSGSGSGGSQEQEVAEPVFLDPQFQQVWEEIRELREANAAKLAAMARQGGGLDPLSVLTARLAALVDTMWPWDTVEGQRGALEYGRKFEVTMSTGLDAVLAQMGQAQLAAGAHVPPELLQQLARQQGLVIPGAEQAKQAKQR